MEREMSDSQTKTNVSDDCSSRSSKNRWQNVKKWTSKNKKGQMSAKIARRGTNILIYVIHSARKHTCVTEKSAYLCQNLGNVHILIY